MKRVQSSEPLNTKLPLILLLVRITFCISFLPNCAPEMRERQQLFFELRLVSEEFQHPAIQTKIVQSFGRIFHQIKVCQQLGFYTNRDPNKQEVGFIFVWSSYELWSCFKYSELKFKKNQKPPAVDVLFEASNRTTLMQIQSGRMGTFKMLS